MWLELRAQVNLPSPRFWLRMSSKFRLVNDVVPVVTRSPVMRPAPKNHNLSFTIGPPKVASWVLMSLSVRLSLGNGVSFTHLLLSKVMR